MITSRLEGDIVWLVIDGEFLASEILAETNQWLSRRDEFVGYLTDVRKMTKMSPVEQKKVEEARRSNPLKTEKPRAVLGNDPGMSAVLNIYTRFTGATGLRYFTKEEEAKAWLHGQRG